MSTSIFIIAEHNTFLREDNILGRVKSVGTVRNFRPVQFLNKPFIPFINQGCSTPHLNCESSVQLQEMMGTSCAVAPHKSMDGF